MDPPETPTPHPPTFLSGFYDCKNVARRPRGRARAHPGTETQIVSFCDATGSELSVSLQVIMVAEHTGSDAVASLSCGYSRKMPQTVAA